MFSGIDFWIQMRKALLSVSMIIESQPLSLNGFCLQY